MSETPLVSIITPSFNQAAFLERAILSVLNQDYKNVEYIIMDGGSEDESASIIKKYKTRIAYWESCKDKGQTDAINKGFSRAHGQYLAWINSDDTLEPNAVSSALDCFKKHPDAGLIYGDCNFIDKDDRIIGKFNAKQTNLRRLRHGYVHIPQQAAFFRADLWKQVGPLDDSFFFAMDYDLWVRLAKVAPVYYESGEVWANFRLHEDAKTVAADERCWPEMLRVHRRDGGSVFSVIYAKYYLRKILAPFITARRAQMFKHDCTSK